MANPSSLKDSAYLSAGNTLTLVASLDVYVNSGLQTLGLDVDRSYTFAHDGLDHNGNTDVNIILMSVSGNSLGSFTNNQVGFDKIRLINSRPITIGPGVFTVWFKSVNGGPQFSVISSEKFYGKF